MIYRNFTGIESVAKFLQDSGGVGLNDEESPSATEKEVNDNE